MGALLFWSRCKGHFTCCLGLLCFCLGLCLSEHGGDGNTVFACIGTDPGCEHILSGSFSKVLRGHGSNDRPVSSAGPGLGYKGLSLVLVVPWLSGTRGKPYVCLMLGPYFGILGKQFGVLHVSRCFGPACCHPHGPMVEHDRVYKGIGPRTGHVIWALAFCGHQCFSWAHVSAWANRGILCKLLRKQVHVDQCPDSTCQLSRVSHGIFYFWYWAEALGPHGLCYSVFVGSQLGTDMDRTGH